MYLNEIIYETAHIGIFLIENSLMELHTLEYVVIRKT